jgi:hypothetical protein
MDPEYFGTNMTPWGHTAPKCPGLQGHRANAFGLFFLGPKKFEHTGVRASEMGLGPRGARGLRAREIFASACKPE